MAGGHLKGTAHLFPPLILSRAKWRHPVSREAVTQKRWNKSLWPAPALRWLLPVSISKRQPDGSTVLVPLGFVITCPGINNRRVLEGYISTNTRQSVSKELVNGG